MFVDFPYLILFPWLKDFGEAKIAQMVISNCNMFHCMSIFSFRALSMALKRICNEVKTQINLFVEFQVSITTKSIGSIVSHKTRIHLPCA
jgi:hypothetical protein